MTTEQVEEVFTEKGLTGKDFYQVCCQDYTSAGQRFCKMRFSVMLEPESYMINLTGKELITKVSSKKDRPLSSQRIQTLRGKRQGCWSLWDFPRTYSA